MLASAIPFPGYWGPALEGLGAAAQRALGVLGMLLSLSGDTPQNNDKLVTVQHFTNANTAQLIQAGGNTLRPGSYVTLPSQVAGMNQAQVAQALEINPANAQVSSTFQTPESNLAQAPAEHGGPTTSGGAIQYTLIDPTLAGVWVPTPK
jgi:hypothetical protein